jgi:hypothetical protein
MNAFRLSESEARNLSSELRSDSSGDVRRRRAVVGLSTLGTASLGLIALYQMGIIKHLPESICPNRSCPISMPRRWMLRLKSKELAPHCRRGEASRKGPCL